MKLSIAITKRAFLGLISLVLFLSLTSGCGYNEIQVMDEEINGKWAQIENQLQRRNDLIPNLVKVVKSYAKHEKEVFTRIAEARSKLSGAMKSGSPKQIAGAEAQFGSALGRLLAISENYPDLKANEQYTRLMDELSGTENRIAVARMDYNNAVKDYNGYIRKIPQTITAQAIGAEKREYYEPPAETQKAPEIEM